MKLSLMVLGLVLAASPAWAQSGRWITQSGNFEVEIAPCGEALCGTTVKILANHSMSNSGAESASTPALGMRLLQDFVPDGENRWSGHLYDRENGKTYRCRMTLLSSDELEIHPYVGLPIFGSTQVWRRPFAQ